MTLLFCFAHPDDESFSGVGTAMKYGEAGARTVLVTATRGERGKAGDPPVCRIEDLGAWRERELREAASIAGFDDLQILGYRDQELAAARPDEMRRLLVPILRRERPEVVATFDPQGYNLHPDHVAISRYTSDAIAASADPRWYPELGPAHAVSRLIWTPPLAPWEAARSADLTREPGADFVIDVSPWRARKAAALRAHRSQHLSVDKYFFNQPDVDRVLATEIWRHAWGPAAPRPSFDVFEGIRSG